MQIDDLPDLEEVEMEQVQSADDLDRSEELGQLEMEQLAAIEGDRNSGIDNDSIDQWAIAIKS